MPASVQKLDKLPPIKLSVAPRKNEAASGADHFKDALKTATQKEKETAKEGEQKVAKKPAEKPKSPEKAGKPGKAKSAEGKRKATESAPDESESTEVDTTAEGSADPLTPIVPDEAPAEEAHDDGKAVAKKGNGHDQTEDAKDSAELSAASTAASQQAVQAVDASKKDKKQNSEQSSSDEEATDVAVVDGKLQATEGDNEGVKTEVKGVNTKPGAEAATSKKNSEPSPANWGDDAPVAAETHPAKTTAGKKEDASSSLLDLDGFSPVVPTDQLPDLPEKHAEKPVLDVAIKTEDLLQPSKAPAATGTMKAPGLPAAPPEAQFAEANHDKIVTSVREQLLPHGGAMQIRLDPPELGALKVMVEMRDGVMTATFQTSNDDATRLLSHSLNQLKHVLEGQGVNVEKLQVQQAPKSEHSKPGDDGNQQQQSGPEDHAAKQEKQRKEMMARMWRRVNGLADPMDVTA